jgi:hypothetical protein
LIPKRRLGFSIINKFNFKVFGVGLNFRHKLADILNFAAYNFLLCSLIFELLDGSDGECVILIAFVLIVR